VLGQICELQKPVGPFLEYQGKDRFLQALKNDSCQVSLAGLTDAFEALNTPNLKFQGTNTTVITHRGIIEAFASKLHLVGVRMSLHFLDLMKLFRAIFLKVITRKKSNLI
jgi:hypothetical protein